MDAQDIQQLITACKKIKFTGPFILHSLIVRNTMSRSYLFTSESVSEGHPDKMADQISDSVLDAMLAQDPRSRVACETMVTTGMAVIAGEITTTAIVDFQDIARSTIRDIGYTSSDIGFDANTCAVLVALDKQSPDIAQGVNEGDNKEQGAGDQGLMFGYACNETDNLMPAPIDYAHRLVRRQSEAKHGWYYIDGHQYKV